MSCLELEGGIPDTLMAPSGSNGQGNNLPTPISSQDVLNMSASLQGMSLGNSTCFGSQHAGRQHSNEDVVNECTEQDGGGGAPTNLGNQDLNNQRQDDLVAAMNARLWEQNEEQNREILHLQQLIAHMLEEDEALPSMYALREEIAAAQQAARLTAGDPPRKVVLPEIVPGFKADPLSVAQGMVDPSALIDLWGDESALLGFFEEILCILIMKIVMLTGVIGFTGISLKLEKAFLAVEYISYLLLTLGARQKALKGEEEIVLGINVSGQFTTRQRDRSEDFNINSVDWHSAAATILGQMQPDLAAEYEGVTAENEGFRSKGKPFGGDERLRDQRQNSSQTRG
ncbi:hypothetical protein BDQ17DRAFT_1514921 [Cyathus striatus]|nr:hypothetical protein BDQ17DRAFT_1514921 [Cyathus striatus]